MDDSTNFRMERIEKLLHELRYEIERGMMENEIDETLEYSFIHPFSRRITKGVVMCKFYTRPVLDYDVLDREMGFPRLRVIK